jgi:hypothetical protein
MPLVPSHFAAQAAYGARGIDAFLTLLLRSQILRHNFNGSFMSDNWKKPLREIRHHFSTAMLITSMLLFDFLPVAVLLGLMETSEPFVQKKNWFVVGTPLAEVMNHIEVFLLITFMGLGAVKIVVRLGFSVSEMGRVKNAP